MKRVLSGQSATVAVPVPDLPGAALSAIVMNGAGVVLADMLSISSGEPGTQMVAVPASANMLGARLRDVRVVRVRVERDEESQLFDVEYIVEAEEVLVEGVNSFQGYAAALLVSLDIPGINAWGDADKSQRIAALIEARRTLARYRFSRIHTDQSIDTQLSGVGNLLTLSQSEWCALPTGLKEALCRAQVIQANYLLGNREYETLRDNGVLSEKIGDSSVTFSETRPSSKGVDRRAVAEISRYIAGSLVVERG